MQRDRRVTEALRGHFRPEFLNRIDEIIIFDRLDDRQITRIVDIQLQRLRGAPRMPKTSPSSLTDAAQKFLAREGYDPAYGARPLKRVIQREILDPLSMEILDGKFHEGDRITVDAAGDHLAFDNLLDRQTILAAPCPALRTTCGELQFTSILLAVVRFWRQSNSGLAKGMRTPSSSWIATLSEASEVNPRSPCH